jgi:hypothetical protein
MSRINTEGEDYQNLFKDYKLSRPLHRECLDRLHQFLKANVRIVATCFEHEPLHYHRHVICDYLKNTYAI